MNISKDLKELMGALSISPLELSDRSGLSVMDIENLLDRNYTEMGPLFTTRLAKGLGVKMSYFQDTEFDSPYRGSEKETLDKLDEEDRRSVVLFCKYLKHSIR